MTSSDDKPGPDWELPPWNDDADRLAECTGPHGAQVHLRRGPTNWQGRVRQVVCAFLALVVLAPLLLYEISGLNEMRAQPRIGIDYAPAVQFVAERHQPGEPVIVAWPPTAYLGIENREDIIFVPGPADRERTYNFARIDANGEYVDFWTGSPTIVSTGQLCQVMLTRQDFWLIVDTGRLRSEWAYAGEMADVMIGLTVHDRSEWRGGQAQVRRLAPEDDRDPAALAICRDAMAREGLG
jgi:hypothetical protein